MYKQLSTTQNANKKNCILVSMSQWKLWLWQNQKSGLYTILSLTIANNWSPKEAYTLILQDTVGKTREISLLKYVVMSSKICMWQPIWCKQNWQ